MKYDRKFFTSTDLFELDTLEEIKIVDADLSGIDFEGMAFEGCTLEDVDFSGADLAAVLFEGCTLTNVIFDEDADCIFENCTFCGCEPPASATVRNRKVAPGTW